MHTYVHQERKNKRDVGMACQKYTPKGGYKSEGTGKYTKPHPFLYLFTTVVYFLARHLYISFHL